MRVVLNKSVFLLKSVISRPYWVILLKKSGLWAFTAIYYKERNADYCGYFIFLVRLSLLKSRTLRRRPLLFAPLERIFCFYVAVNVNYQKFLYFRHCARIAAQGMAQKIMFNYLYKQNNARFLCWAKRAEFKRQRKLRRTPSARLQTISFPHTTESPLWIFIKVSFLRLNAAWKGKIFRRNANARPFYRQSS